MIIVLSQVFTLKFITARDLRALTSSEKSIVFYTIETSTRGESLIREEPSTSTNISLY